MATQPLKQSLLDSRVWFSKEQCDESEPNATYIRHLLSKGQLCFDPIAERATSIRSVSCVLDSSRMSTGSFCVSFPIIFEDGVFWLLRIRCPPQESGTKSEVWQHSLPTFTAVSSMIDSSVATIKYVQTHSQIPVPTIHFYDSGYDNAFLAPYIVMDYIDGLPAPWSDIDLENEKQSTNFYSQLCGISLAMSRLRFHQSGYIQSISSDPPIIEALHEWDRKQNGSFQRAIDYYRQLVDNYWKHACGGCTTKASLSKDWNWTVALPEEKDLFTAYLHRECLARILIVFAISI